MSFCMVNESSMKIQEILDIPQEKTNTDAIEYFDDDSIFAKIRSSSSLFEIQEILNEYEIKFNKFFETKRWRNPRYFPSMHKLYALSIRRILNLSINNNNNDTNTNNLEDGLSLFNKAKSKQYVSSNLYASMMRLIMHSDPTRDGLNQTFDLYNEMKDKYNLIPTSSIYSTIIYNCVHAAQYNKAYNILDKIKNHKNANMLLSKQRLLQSICYLYYKSNNIDNGLIFIFKIYKTFKIIPNSFQSTILLNGISENIGRLSNTDDIDKKEKILKYLNYAQKLFDFVFEKNQGITPRITTFNAYLNVFGNIGDYDTCFKLIECMINNDKYPNPDLYSFNILLQSILNYQQDDKQFENEIIKIIDLINNLNLSINIEMYCNLIKISAKYYNINKIYSYYNQIKNEWKNSEIIELIANALIHCFKNMGDIDDDKISEFKSWIIGEYKQYNNLPLVEQEETNRLFEEAVNNQF